MGRGNFCTSPWRGEAGARSASGGGEFQDKDHPTPDRFQRSDPPPPGEGERKITWLALEPLTGRTHQLRVHCAEMGWPILGDNIYGSAPRNSVSLGGPPLHLHSREIVVPISKNKPAVVVQAPPPQHMREMLRACGWREEPTTFDANKAAP
jgi:tRNA pseudouridine32 synthase/23S rRNA pseudouridine746 synthase